MPVGPLILAGWMLLGSRDEPVASLNAFSPQPASCAPASSAFGRVATLLEHEYCAALASGFSSLRRDPARAQQAALRALALFGHARGSASASKVNASRRAPSEAIPLVLLARAELGLGRPQAAWGAFERALRLTDVGGLSAPALHDLAVAAALSGQDLIALSAYRRLLPRLDELEAGRQAQVPLEAALAALRVSADHVAEARAAVHRALRDRSERIAPRLARAMLALADELVQLSPELPDVADVHPGPVVPEPALTVDASAAAGATALPADEERPMDSEEAKESAAGATPAARLSAQALRIPAAEWALLGLVLRDAEASDAAQLRTQELALSSPNPRWRAIARRHLEH